MTVEVRPLGVQCNLGCRYCYQNPQRQAGNGGRPYDLDAMKSAIEAEGGPFAVFGGEVLLVPIEDLEKLWSWGLEKYGDNAIQTNGTLITDAHVDLFHRYRVRIGISVDGPDELNDLRWQGTLERTREATRRTLDAIDRLCAEGLAPRVIITLHRANATGARLPRLIEWVRQLDARGITSMRLHMLESEDDRIRKLYALSQRENVEVMLAFARLESELDHLRFDLFREAEALLMGKDAGVSCVWRACDPYTTAAVRGVEGNGQRTNCGRTNKDGVDFVKSEEPEFERSLILRRTPFSAGGCGDCRFFIFCKGQCPGTAIDGDWRNRSEHCEVWFELFSHVEEHLLSRGERPLSASDDERRRVEARLMAAWEKGTNPTIEQVLV